MTQMTENLHKEKHKRGYRVTGVLHELHPKTIQLRSAMCRQYYLREKFHTSSWPQGGRLGQVDSTIETLECHTVT